MHIRMHFGPCIIVFHVIDIATAYVAMLHAIHVHVYAFMGKATYVATYKTSEPNLRFSRGPCMHAA